MDPDFDIDAAYEELTHLDDLEPGHSDDLDPDDEDNYDEPATDPETGTAYGDLT